MPGPTSFFDHFESLPDPRVERCKLHDLQEIIFMSICAVICGADDYVAIEQFAKGKEDWLRQFLKLENGIPSHDTFGRVFAALDSAAFADRFLSWVRSIAKLTEHEVVAIDGKTLRRSHQSDGSPLHVVSAFASANGLVLGQQKVDDHSNEITAIPRLLELLALKGCIVTIDAMGTQRTIAEQIVDQEADYVLALKGNQGLFFQEVQQFFDSPKRREAARCAAQETIDGDHGRIEIRRCVAAELEQAKLFEIEEWKGLRSIAMIECERHVGQKRSYEKRYYISSLAPDAALILEAARTHWCIENQLHWVLDVAFCEDQARMRVDHAAENMAIVRKMAINALKKEATLQIGIANKRLRAGWDETYLAKVLKAI